MTPLVVGLFLIALMLLANFWSVGRDFDEQRPLDVDDDLPWPEAAQASSVFSLTALFTAYLTVALVTGLPALVGVALGTVLLLVRCRKIVEKSGALRFEQFVEQRLSTPARQPLALAFLLVLMQLGLAVSEIVVLRNVAVAGFGMLSRHALLLALAVAIVAYYYCLVGGYRTLFRADVVQFLAIGIMCVTLAYQGLQRIAHGTPILLSDRLRPNPAFWNFGFDRLAAPWNTLLLVATHVAIGFVMGAAYVAASPDTWKRVFVAVRKRPSAGAFWRLVVAGALPFAALIPFVIATPSPNLATFVPITFFFRAQHLTLASSSVMIGILGTFLSSFAGALISITQLMLLIRRSQGRRSDLRTYRITMGTAFLATLAASLALGTQGNPFFMGHVLIGAYSIAGGLLLGTRGVSRRIDPHRLRGSVTVLGCLWLSYLLSDGRSLNEWSAFRDSRAIAVGCAFFLIAFGLSFFIAPLSSEPAEQELP
jgi:hypothetical protein